MGIQEDADANPGAGRQLHQKAGQLEELRQAVLASSGEVDGGRMAERRPTGRSGFEAKVVGGVGGKGARWARTHGEEEMRDWIRRALMGPATQITREKADRRCVQIGNRRASVFLTAAAGSISDARSPFLRCSRAILERGRTSHVRPLRQSARLTSKYASCNPSYSSSSTNLVDAFATGFALDNEEHVHQIGAVGCGKEVVEGRHAPQFWCSIPGPLRSRRCCTPTFLGGICVGNAPWLLREFVHLAAAILMA
ncbi:hypothetical protein L226DRAFT_525845 [Lentinus tigrinus ALCF2SS1-7]|uniref:uncharacterized protein n=1 Tax=Lentinus tigrinus ALCF2SS1-7 TaxID=1328758 RepID=UPI0011661D92|nr:hypothetical protein L226DRAFT_525845 [Lentinus tigrinus ALCF2SS1-7]